MVSRIETASPLNKRTLLKQILPWLRNIELVDVLVLPLQDTQPSHTSNHCPDSSHLSSLKGTGWGCHQASELVLNNLLYLTLDLSQEFTHEVTPSNVLRGVIGYNYHLTEPFEVVSSNIHILTRIVFSSLAEPLSHLNA